VNDNIEVEQIVNDDINNAENTLKDLDESITEIDTQQDNNVADLQTEEQIIEQPIEGIEMPTADDYFEDVQDDIQEIEEVQDEYPNGTIIQAKNGETYKVTSKDEDTYLVTNERTNQESEYSLGGLKRLGTVSKVVAQPTTNETNEVEQIVNDEENITEKVDTEEIGKEQINQYKSLNYPEYNNLSIAELETEVKNLKSVINENYQKFTRTAASKGKGQVEKFSDAESRLKEVEYLLGKTKPIFYRTQEQVNRTLKMPMETHKKYIKQALEEGQYVPEEVLRDYPDLMPQETSVQAITDTTANETETVEQSIEEDDNVVEMADTEKVTQEEQPTEVTEETNQYELKSRLDDLMSKLAIATTEQEKAEINDKIASLKLQLFANGTATEVEGTGEFEVSKFYTNSLKNALYVPENVKDLMEETDFLYETQTNEGQLKQALKNIDKDMNAVISKIKNSTSLKGGVQSAEALLIHKIYIEQGKLTGDYSKAIEWSKTIRPKITNTAQSLQALSMFKRFTADNILLQATRTAEESRTRTEDDKIDKTADKIKGEFDNAEKEKAGEVADDLEKNANDELAKKKAKNTKSNEKPTQKEIDEIEPADLLVAKIESTLKD